MLLAIKRYLLHLFRKYFCMFLGMDYNLCCYSCIQGCEVMNFYLLSFSVNYKYLILLLFLKSKIKSLKLVLFYKVPTMAQTHNTNICEREGKMLICKQSRSKTSSLNKKIGESICILEEIGQKYIYFSACWHLIVCL